MAQGCVAGRWWSQDRNADVVLQNPSLPSCPVVLPRRHVPGTAWGWQRTEAQGAGEKGRWSGGWAAVRTPEGRSRRGCEAHLR